MEITSQNNIFDPVEVDNDYFLEHLEEQDQFYATVRALPEPIMNILFGLNTADTIKKICETHQLQPRQSANLSKLIRKVLAIEIYLGEFVNQIKEKIGVDEFKAKAVANDILNQLFSHALEDIKKMHIEKFGKPVSTSPPPVNPNNVLDLRNKQ